MFTVIIATCNRPDRLLAALEATHEAIKADDAEHCIVVSDNGTTRLAREGVDGFAATAECKVEYVRSSPLDKSAALNAAIAAAGTEWLAFTDDDCTPTAAWLREGRRYAETAGLRVFSGRLQAGPVDFDLPKWLPAQSCDELPWSPAFVDYAPRNDDGVLNDSERVPFGANIFVQKSVYDEFGGYDEALWARCGSAALGSEDAEFAMRVRDRGLQIGYCHNALVVHPVFPERVTRDYYLKHIYHFGIREPFFAADGEQAAYGYLIKSGVKSLCKSAASRLSGDRVASMREFMNATRDWGEIVGWRRFAQQAAKH